MEQKRVRESWFQPGFPELKMDDVGKAAVNGQFVEYPKIVRGDNDPYIPGQQYGLVSFILFDTPRRFEGKPIYGFVKLRGNYDSSEVAKAKADKIILEFDSKYQVRAAPIGQYVPITDNDRVVQDLIDVRESEKEIHLRDNAIKQKEKEIERQAREIREAEEKCRNGPDEYDDQESIRFYTMKRVTEMRVREACEAQLTKFAQLQKTLGETRLLLKKLEAKHVDYPCEWIGVYNDERAKSGLPKFVPSEKEFCDYEAMTLEELTKMYGKPSMQAQVTVDQDTSDISQKSKKSAK